MGKARESIQEQAIDVAEIKTTMASVKEDIGDIKEAIIGNGREGLLVRVARVEGKSKFNMWFSLLLIAAVFLTGIGALITHLLGK